MCSLSVYIPGFPLAPAEGTLLSQPAFFFLSKMRERVIHLGSLDSLREGRITVLGKTRFEKKKKVCSRADLNPYHFLTV
jgi:hypothetical protein